MASSSNSALRMLSAYDSSDSSTEEDIAGSKANITQKISKEMLESKRALNSTSLPLPPILNSLFPALKDVTEENSSEHGDRIRSFPHERGNWSSFIYIPYEPPAVFESFVDVTLAYLERVAPMKSIADPHISLTRTVVLQHHWIESFVTSVQQQIKELPRFHVDLGCMQVYCNEERTRTFVGPAVLFGRKALLDSVQILDKCLAEFRLPPFYLDPSFHMSIAWCTGDRAHDVQEVLPHLELIFQQFLHAHPDQWSIHVHQFMFKTGNKLFAFSLGT